MKRQGYIRVIVTVLALGALAGIYFTRVERKVKVVAVERDSLVGRGVAAIDWQRKLLAGDTLRIRGRWAGPSVKIVLMGMGAVVDSAITGGEFTVGVMPPQHGRAVYTLAAVSGSDTLEKEEIPVEVEQGRPLRVLLLAASPDFENTFLFNFLSGAGDAVASRTMVSKDKYQNSFANMAERPLGELGPALLDGFDVVVADKEELTPMIHRVVRERGLGLYVKGDNTHYADWMAGKRQAYAAYWSKALRKLARRNDTAAEWSWQPALPRVGAPVEAVVKTGAAMPSGLLGDDVVYLAQDAVLPFRWRGSYWPRQAGWLAAHIPGGDTTWEYVWPADAWKGMYPGGASKELTIVAEKAVLGRGWLYVVFFLCIFFLWIERKVLKL